LELESIQKLDKCTFNLNAAACALVGIPSMLRDCRNAMLNAQGEPLLNPATRKAETVLAEFRASKADVWSSKDVLQIIRRKTAPATGAASSSVPSTPVAAIGGPSVGVHRLLLL
jgi:hypothetical protein